MLPCAQVSAVSFDAWLTFIKSNPRFKPARAAALADALGYSDIEHLLEVSKTLDRAMDKRSDLDGMQYGFNERVEAIYVELYGRQPDFSTRFLPELDEEIGRLMERYPPLLIEEDFPETLRILKTAGLKLALVSNTGFIDGVHMRKAFQTLGVWEYFDVTLFSNEVGVSKPNPQIYRVLSDRLGIPSYRIVHVGDNYLADYCGARAAGMMALHLSQDAAIESDKISALSQLRDLCLVHSR